MVLQLVLLDRFFSVGLKLYKFRVPGLAWYLGIDRQNRAISLAMEVSYCEPYLFMLCN
jgi:hypothetical protein